MGLCVAVLALVSSAGGHTRGQPQADRPELVVRPAADFEVTGTGAHQAWRSAEWVPIPRRQPKGLFDWLFD